MCNRRDYSCMIAHQETKTLFVYANVCNSQSISCSVLVSSHQLEMNLSEDEEKEGVAPTEMEGDMKGKTPVVLPPCWWASRKEAVLFKSAGLELRTAQCSFSCDSELTSFLAAPISVCSSWMSVKSWTA